MTTLRKVSFFLALVISFYLLHSNQEKSNCTRFIYWYHLNYNPPRLSNSDFYLESIDCETFIYGIFLRPNKIEDLNIHWKYKTPIDTFKIIDSVYYYKQDDKWEKFFSIKRGEETNSFYRRKVLSKTSDSVRIETEAYKLKIIYDDEWIYSRTLKYKWIKLNLDCDDTQNGLNQSDDSVDSKKEEIYLKYGFWLINGEGLINMDIISKTYK